MVVADVTVDAVADDDDAAADADSTADSAADPLPYRL